MAKFRVKINKITSDYKRDEEAKQSRLKKNKKEQEDLRRRLKELEEEASQLEDELASGQSQNAEATTSREEAESGVERWKDRILELQERTKTSLMVVNEMKGKGGREGGEREEGGKGEGGKEGGEGGREGVMEGHEGVKVSLSYPTRCNITDYHRCPEEAACVQR